MERQIRQNFSMKNRLSERTRTFLTCNRFQKRSSNRFDERSCVRSDRYAIVSRSVL